MTDTDDTDDLLLIPPDFFLIHSDHEETGKPYGPYYNVVDSLISQVNKLENRINFIETNSDNSLLNSSLDYFVDNNTRTANLMSFHKFNSWEDIPKLPEVYSGSTHSTPQKPRTKFKLNSLPSTPSTERNPPRRTRVNVARASVQYDRGDGVYAPQASRNFKHSLPSSITHVDKKHDKDRNAQKVQNQMLNEIDTFITNVKTIQKYNAARNLNPEFDSYQLHDRKSANYAGNSDTTTSGLKLSDVDRMLNAMESRQQNIESKSKENKQDHNTNRESAVESKEHFYKENVWQQGDTKGSVPDRGMGMRDILYDEQYKIGESLKSPVKEDNCQKRTVNSLNSPVKEDHFQSRTVNSLNSQEASTSDISARNTESLYSDNSPSLSSSDSTQLTAYQTKDELKNAKKTNNSSQNSDKIHANAVQALNMHKKLLSRNTLHNPYFRNEVGKPEKVSVVHNSDKAGHFSFQNDLFENKSPDYGPSTSNALALLSLGDLWNHSTGSDLQNYDRSKFLNKLQEEKLRRQHCEQLIQELQTRTLELQERLAVAVQVDRAKDEAILRVHKSWEEAAATIDTLNNDKLRLEQQITELKARISLELSEATKKVNHYENESSKALTLAHNNQEKLVTLEKQNALLTAETRELQHKLKTLQDNYNHELNNTQQLSKILSQKEIELNENKNILTEARKEIAQSKRAVEICQAELTGMKMTQEQFEVQIKENIEQIKTLQLEKNKLLANIESHKKIEKVLQDDLNKQKDINEHNKIELRNFYQDQVEVVVRDKLREFQSQLEKAENSLQDEIRSRELAVAKAAAVHIQQVTEKHTLEVHLLEEKHKEEVKLYKLQSTQLRQQMDNLQLKFQQQQERRTNMAQQLRKIMEAQWLEAIKIINNGKSPIVSQDKSTNTIDQLNTLKSKSYSNLEELLFKDDTGSNKTNSDKVYASKVPFLQGIESMSSIIEDDSYEKMIQALETPVTSKPQQSRQQTEIELQKYVQMLLNKSPGNPVDDYPKSQSPDHMQWQSSQSDKANPDGTKSNKISARDRQGKPPWK